MCHIHRPVSSCLSFVSKFTLTDSFFYIVFLILNAHTCNHIKVIYFLSGSVYVLYNLTAVNTSDNWETVLGFFIFLFLREQKCKTGHLFGILENRSSKDWNLSLWHSVAYRTFLSKQTVKLVINKRDIPQRRRDHHKPVLHCWFDLILDLSFLRYQDNKKSLIRNRFIPCNNVRLDFALLWNISLRSCSS